MAIGKIAIATLLNGLQWCGRHLHLQDWFNRRFWLNVHLILALSLGFIFAILGFTGSISVYREEIDTLLNPQLVIENPQGDYQSLDDLMASVRRAHPDKYGEWTLEMPRSPRATATAWFEKPRETFFERYAPLMVSVNPYTAEIVTSRFWGQTLTTWLLDMHTQLQISDSDMGWNIVGFSGLLLMFSVCSGLYLWWPGVNKSFTAFRIRLNEGLMRLLFDMHRMVGLLSAAALLVLAFTGMQLSFPVLLENLAGSSGMAHGETGRSIASTAIPNDRPTLLEAAEFVARAPFPNAELRRVTTPAGDSGVYRVNLRQKDEINQRHPYTTVWIDRWSGQIREVRDPKAFGIGEKMIVWMWPLHTGEALGPAGRFCWFLAGQSLFFLYVSGIVRWLHKKGAIKDRPVAAADFTNTKTKLKKGLYGLLLTIDTGMNVLVCKAMPHISRLAVLSAKWLERNASAYREKVKK